MFGILKRREYVATYIVENCSASVLFPIVKMHATTDSTIYTDGFKTYNLLKKNGYEKHYAVNHGGNEFAKENGINTNRIENFWGICKSRLSKFRGINKDTFYLHLKECEFRYNNKDKNIYKILIDNCKL